MSARQIEVTIGGEKYFLRRSWASGKALRARFNGQDPIALISQSKDESAQMDAILGMLVCMLRDKEGKPVPEPPEGWEEWIDMGDSGALVNNLIALMSDGKPADPRSLAPFVPTPEALVKRMLDVADLGAGEVLLDPCCGDGRVLAAACARGARAIGYEMDAGRAQISRAAVAGMPAEVHESDGAEADYSVADVVFLYTLPESNRKLQPLLLAQCKDSARIVSHAFDMPGWPAAHGEAFEGKRFYMWRMGDVRAALATAAA